MPQLQSAKELAPLFLGCPSICDRLRDKAVHVTRCSTSLQAIWFQHIVSVCNEKAGRRRLKQI